MHRDRYPAEELCLGADHNTTHRRKGKRELCWNCQNDCVCSVPGLSELASWSYSCPMSPVIIMMLYTGKEIKSQYLSITGKTTGELHIFAIYSFGCKILLFP